MGCAKGREPIYQVACTMEMAFLMKKTPSSPRVNALWDVGLEELLWG